MEAKARVLYIVHSIPEFDKSGTPYAAWRMATLAKKLHGVEVGFLIGSADNKLRLMHIENIPVFALPQLELYSNFFEDAKKDRLEYLGWVDAVLRDFKPTILHIYNFIGFTYQILRLKTRYPELKILRTVTHTEDVCFCIDPVMMDSQGHVEHCQEPFSIEKCAEHYQASSSRIQGNIPQLIAEHYQQLNTYYQQYVDGVIFSGQAFHDYMAKIFTLPKKRWFVPYGILPLNKQLKDRPEQPDAATSLKLTFIGGIGPRKGLGLLLKAIRLQPDIMRSIHLQIVGPIGKNPIYPELMAIQELFPTQMEILGHLSDEELDHVMRSTDIAVLPSYFETYNITLRELLLRGTPAIVTDTYGSEIIKQGVNGFVFPRGDVEALIEIIQKLIQDRGMVCRLQEGARQTPIETLEEECRKIVAVYRDLLTGAEKQ